MKHNILFLIFITFVLSSCHSSNYGQRKNEITKIEIATGGCFGPCQSTVTSIDSSLEYRYFGGDTYFSLPPDGAKEGKLKGFYSGKISQGFWDTLNIKFENINYKHLDTSYQHSVDDQGLEIFIHYGNKVKHIMAQSASLPNTAAEVFYYVINSYKTVKPKLPKDTFLFESQVQRPIPMPDVRKVKFLPPLKKN
ncbi:DUF6438 domain-containing protein [Mucilaginibacter sp. cycad4]|uniref:DUF6438 domain-containing protein n=1 Tax=Mucilaginibacter sp. cycad4 TaxID=3342096 RepID=UPI002AAC3D67|nr:DUF6438 domain-containing protein [Mucilaginibacter gossypii]WPU98508.1 DUF6438 domain-containing protein [Mucilaginibacter gossypii]